MELWENLPLVMRIVVIYFGVCLAAVIWVAYLKSQPGPSKVVVQRYGEYELTMAFYGGSETIPPARTEMTLCRRMRDGLVVPLSDENITLNEYSKANEWLFKQTGCKTTATELLTPLRMSESDHKFVS